MIFLLLAAAICSSLRVFESYEVDGILTREKGVHEVYLLVLFRAPPDVAVTSSAFSRLIGAIPIPVDPFLGIVVDPSVQYNQLLYQDKSGSSTRIRFPYRQVLREYVDSVSSGVSHEVRIRLQAILATVNDSPSPSKSDEVNRWRRDYAAKGVRLNMSRAVEELVVLKNQERAGLIRQALDIQRTLDGEVGAHRSLPAFAQVDPSKGEYDAQVGPDEDELKGEKQGGSGFDEESSENDDVAGEDEAPKSLVNTKPQGDNDDEVSTGPSEDDAEEDRKRAGPIMNAWEAVRDKFRRKAPKSGDEENEEDESDAPKKKNKEESEANTPKKRKKDEDDVTLKKEKVAEGSVRKKKVRPKQQRDIDTDNNPNPSTQRRPEVRPEGEPPAWRPRFGPGRITEPPSAEPPKVEQQPPEPPKEESPRVQPRFGPGRITEPPEVDPPPHRFHRPLDHLGPDRRALFPKPEEAAHREEHAALPAVRALDDVVRWNRGRQRRAREVEANAHQADQ
jgi:hypothetical protein